MTYNSRLTDYSLLTAKKKRGEGRGGGWSEHLRYILGGCGIEVELISLQNERSCIHAFAKIFLFFFFGYF